jgi:hypothetical protein
VCIACVWGVRGLRALCALRPSMGCVRACVRVSGCVRACGGAYGGVCVCAWNSYVAFVACVRACVRGVCACRARGACLSCVHALVRGCVSAFVRGAFVYVVSKDVHLAPHCAIRMQHPQVMYRQCYIRDVVPPCPQVARQ